jgi:hypothetical protein
MNTELNTIVDSDFYKARTRALISRIAHIFSSHSEELMPFEEAKRILKPDSETYAGITTVPVERIVGSEGRYRDFNRHFLPKKEHLRARWTSVDKTRYQDIILPPVRLYEMGGVYFVRDGNHRVSVARSMGQMEIDAEVTSLQSRIHLGTEMDIQDLKRAVIEMEKSDFFDETHYLTVIGEEDLEFSEPGRFDTIREHIAVHKYFLNEREDEELDYAAALWSWHENVYEPIVLAIREEKLLPLFPGRTEGDLYIYLVRHWDDLKHARRRDIAIGDAAKDFRKKHLGGKSGFLKSIKSALLKALGK